MGAHQKSPHTHTHTHTHTHKVKSVWKEIHFCSPAAAGTEPDSSAAELPVTAWSPWTP